MDEECRSTTGPTDRCNESRPDAILSRLEELQAVTVALLDQARATIDAGPTQQDQLRTVADRLAYELQAYQLFKHDRIFDPLIASGSPSSREAARCLKADCVAGGEAFAFFVRQWREQDLQAGWGEFRPAVLNLGTRLRDHIKAEEVQVRLLLSRVRQEANGGVKR